jgi:hypothetical protein
MKFHYNKIQQQQKEKEEEEEVVRLGQKRKAKKNSCVKLETRWEGGGKVVVDDKDSEICYTWTLSLSLSLSKKFSIHGLSLSLSLSREILDQQVLTAAFVAVKLNSLVVNLV